MKGQIQANSNIGDAEILPGKLGSLRLDESSPDDAIRLFGRPHKDVFDDLGFSGTQTFIGFNIKSLFSPGTQPKAFRKLTFKKVEGVDSLYLRFLDDKLVQMMMDCDLGKGKNKILAKRLDSELGTGMVVFEGVGKDTRIKDFEGKREADVPRRYGVTYLMFGVARDRVYLAVINNRAGSFWRPLEGERSTTLFPGYMSELQIISRVLEKN